MEFRVEAFNLFNKANFSLPNRTVFTALNSSEPALATTGVITSTLAQAATGNRRQVQFALKPLF